MITQVVFEITVTRANITFTQIVRSRAFQRFLFTVYHFPKMAQRRSRRIAGLNPETIEDERCIFCLVDEKEGFNILRANVLRFSCCKKFAHRSCQEAWEKISSTCPHCRAEMQNGRNDEPPVAEPLAIVGVEPPLSPSRDDAINALFTTANDQALIQQRIDSVSYFVAR